MFLSSLISQTGVLKKYNQKNLSKY
jgi:hypothetical protein